MTTKPELYVWPQATVNPRMELRRPMRVYWVELQCPNCRPGRLSATGETHEKGNVHACSSCPVPVVVPGEPYPRRFEEIDADAHPMKGG